MKIALITDTHLGVRNDHSAFIEANKKFFSSFYDEIDERGIRRIIHLGDLMDRRKYAAYTTIKHLREDFLQPARDMEIELDIILGNHDTVFKDTNAVNSPAELCRAFDNVRWYESPDEVFVGDSLALFVPWICAENYNESIRLINATKAPLCFGHLELSGFEMYRGQPAETGMDPSVFNKFDMTFSGHYHHKSQANGIYYLGAHGEFTWSDYDDPRGWHVFDTESRELEFIPNPHRMFEKVFYDDSHGGGFEHDSVAGKFVKVIVREKNDPTRFEMFMDILEEEGPIAIQTVDDHLNLDLGDDEEIVDEAQDTLTIFRKAIKTSNTVGIDSSKLDSFIVELYQQALSVE